MGRIYETGPAIDFGNADVTAWCLELAMLLHGISHECTIVDEASLKTVELMSTITDESAGSGSEKSWSLFARATDLRVLHRFFFEYLRDGVATSRAIDFEFYNPMLDESGCATFTVANSVPPLSAEEFKKQFGWLIPDDPDA